MRLYMSLVNGAGMYCNHLGIRGLPLRSTPDGGMSKLSAFCNITCVLLMSKDRLTANDDDKKVRDWFIEETGKYGCHHKVFFQQ